MSNSPLLHCCLVLVVVCSLSLHFCFSISVGATGFSTPAPAVLPLRHHLGHHGVLTLPVYQRSFRSMERNPDHDDVNKRQARRILDLAPVSPPTSYTPSAAPALDSASPPASAPASDTPSAAPSFSAPPADSTNVPELRSNVLTLGEPFGQYFAEMHVGTPAKDVAVIIDTGSEFMWIQCSPCEQCGPQLSAYPIFNSAKSSSYKNVICDDAICQGDDSIATTCSVSGLCSYEVTYGDKTNSSGFLAEETLTFTEAGAASKSFELTQFVFGCGIDNVGVETTFNASGLMGLDRGAYSLISQLGVNSFSYCLPNRVNNVDVSGYLTFGGGAANGDSSSSPSSLNTSLQYTPMVQNNYSTFLSQFYYLGLTGISVDDKLLSIPATAFELDMETGSGGTIIDSGTTLTTFVDEAYTVIAQSIESYMDASYKKLQLDNNSTRLCYELPLSKQGGPPTAPKVILHFTGSVEMELSTDHLFHLSASDATNNYYCLAFLSGGSVAAGAKNVIGNYQQQDFLIEYDLANARIGFAAAKCSPNTTSTNNGPSLLILTMPTWHITLTFTFIALLL